MSDLDAVRQAIAQRDIVAAAQSMKKIYDHWEALPEDIQAEIKNLEPVFLSLVSLSQSSRH